MESDFLQGFQLGTNLFAQAKQLQEARQRSMIQAQEMLMNIRAAQAMQQYRNKQIELARAEEERKSEEWKQTQQLEQRRRQFAPFVQRRFQELQGETPRGLEPGATLEETDPLLRRAITEGLIQYYERPQELVSLLGQQETTRRSENVRESIEGIEANRRRSIENQAVENRKNKIEIARMQIEAKATQRNPHQTSLARAALAEYEAAINMYPPGNEKYQPLIDKAEQTYLRKLEDIDNPTKSDRPVVGRFTADGKYIPR